MNGNNSKTKEQFLNSLGHPRKKELADMIFAGATDDTIKAAGFGDLTIKEMKRDIEKNVKVEDVPETPADESTDDVDENKVDDVDQPNDQTPENETENQVPNESTDSVDPNTPAQDIVPNETVDPAVDTPVSNDGVQQGAQDPTTPATPTQPQA